MKKRKLVVEVVKEGDVFQIPLEGEKAGYGQVMAETAEGTIFVCLFQGTSDGPERPSLSKILKSEIVFAAITFKGHIQLGKWPLVGNAPPVLNRSDFPKYKVGTRGISEVKVRNFDGTKMRPCSEKEEEILAFESFINCALLEKVYQQHFGILKLTQNHDDLKYDYVLKTRGIKI